MTTKKRTKYVHEGQYVAEVDVELIVDDTEWSPYPSLEDVYRLNDVREALRGEIAKTAKRARVYRLQPAPSVRIDVAPRMWDSNWNQERAN